ncbi:MAG: sulfur carrier protein ThiS [Bacteroidales bacterium]|nr:sulfur carrier protein ThiS [Bacteroidales bacterium]
MKIILNNREVFIEKERVNVSELLQIQNFSFRMLIVKINEVVIKKEDYNITYINENDYVAVIHLMSGG